MGELLGYARVSTHEQMMLTGAIAAQTRELEAAGCARIWTEAASGARTDRPQLAALLAYARPGDTVVAVRLDRLGRSLAHLLELGEQLQARGVGLRFLAQGIDTTTAGGRMVYAMLGAIAEFERELIRERTHAGLAAARAAGRRGGRPSVMTPAKLKAARRALQEGATAAEAAETVGVSRASLYRAMKES